MVNLKNLSEEPLHKGSDPLALLPPDLLAKCEQLLLIV